MQADVSALVTTPMTARFRANHAEGRCNQEAARIVAGSKCKPSCHISCAGLDNLNRSEPRPATKSLLKSLRASKASDGELDGGQGYEGGERFGEVLVVLGQTAVAAEPGEGSLDHPSTGQHDEACHVIRTLDDFEPESRQSVQ